MKNSAVKTNAVRLFEQKKLNFKTHCYADSGVVSGMEVAAVLGQDPNIVFKTLVTVGKSGTHYVFVIPVNRELNLKKAAGAVNEKSIAMIKSKELFELTGYIHGGCSPVGMKKQFETVIDASAEEHQVILFSAGKIGYQIESALSELHKLVNFRIADITV